MKRMLTIVVMILISYTQVYALTLSGVVTNVVDGDTIDIGKDRVRLKYIDAPENTLKHIQIYGKESSEYLTSLILNKNVTVTYSKNDLSYGRIVGTVMVGKTNANKMMVSEGYAWSYTGYSTKAFDKLQSAAKLAKIGMWKPELNVTCEPWNFRKKKCAN